MINQLYKFKFIDIHYHADPDLYKRKYNTFEIGQRYKDLNAAVVLKSHLGSTAIQATIAQNAGLPVFPSIVLNAIAGGINYKPVIQALAEYQPTFPSKLIVHLPTITGRKHKSNLIREMVNPSLADTLCQPETVFDSSGNLKSALVDLFKLAKDYPIVLSTGHANKAEVYALIEACQHWNVPALLLNQPANPLTGLNASELLAITQRYPFVWVEQTFLTFLLSYQNEDDFCSVLNGVPRVIYSSDLGQTSQMDLLQWVKSSQKWFNKFKISTTRKEKICLTNPSQLLAM